MRFFRRRQRAPLGTIDERLDRLQAAETPADRAAEIAQLRDLLAVFHDASGDAAQRAVVAMESRLSGQLQTQFGATNEMISSAVTLARAADTRIGGLQEQLTLLGEMFSTVGERLSDLEHGQQTIVDRTERVEQQVVELKHRLDESAADRQALHSEIERIEQLLNEREAGG